MNLKKILSALVLTLALMVSAEIAMAATTIYVDDDCTTPGSGISTDPYCTINDALVAAAASGDTIEVAAGTYTNDIWNSSLGTPAGYRITKSVTLLGAQAGVDPVGSTDRSEETILVRTNGLPYSLYADGITIDGFMIGSSNPNTGGKLMISHDNAIIRNCIIQNTPNTSSGHGVYIYPGVSNTLVEYNTFSNTAWEAIRCDGAAVISGNTIKDIPTNKGIYLGATSDAQVIDNVITDTFYEGIQACGLAEITNNDISGCYKAIQIRDSAAGTIIDGNTIYDNTYEGIQTFVPAIITNNDISGLWHGIQIRDSATGTIIDGNNIHNNTYYGLDILEITAATITNNTFANNEFVGIMVQESASGSGILINCNNIYGNTYFGVESSTTDSNVNAENNWWGDTSGPSGIGPGTGDGVSNNVDYDPWSLTPDPCEAKTIGFWKNHPDSIEAVLTLLGGTIDLGDYSVGTVTDAREVFSNAKNKNANTMLAAQLLAAELNVTHLDHLGIDYCDCIDEHIETADEFLSSHEYNEPTDPGTVPKEDKAEANEIKNNLDDFNNGECLCL